MMTMMIITIMIMIMTMIMTENRERRTERDIMMIMERWRGSHDGVYALVG